MTYRDLWSRTQRFSRNTNISRHYRYQFLLSEDDVVIIEQQNMSTIILVRFTRGTKPKIETGSHK